MKKRADPSLEKPPFQLRGEELGALPGFEGFEGEGGYESEGALNHSSPGGWWDYPSSYYYHYFHYYYYFYFYYYYYYYCYNYYWYYI